MDALVVYNTDKLPAEIKELLDTDRPLPPRMQFFEEKYTYADFAKQFIWGVILVPLGALVLAVASILIFKLDRYSPSYDSMFNTLFTVEAVGFIMAAFGIMLLMGLRSKYRLINRQKQGLDTRHGVFLSDDLLVYRSADAIKVVPKSAFKEMKDRSVKFECEDEVKALELPTVLLSKDPQNLTAAVAKWSA